MLNPIDFEIFLTGVKNYLVNKGYVKCRDMKWLAGPYITKADMDLNVKKISNMYCTSTSFPKQEAEEIVRQLHEFLEVDRRYISLQYLSDSDHFRIVLKAPAKLLANPQVAKKVNSIVNSINVLETLLKENEKKYNLNLDTVSFFNSMFSGGAGLKELEEKIGNLSELANQGDDCAAFALAKQLEVGIRYQIVEGEYLKTATLTDLNRSLYYWNLLNENGYSVDKDLNRVEKALIASSNTLKI